MRAEDIAWAVLGPRRTHRPRPLLAEGDGVGRRPVAILRVDPGTIWRGWLSLADDSDLVAYLADRLSAPLAVVPTQIEDDHSGSDDGRPARRRTATIFWPGRLQRHPVSASSGSQIDPQVAGPDGAAGTSGGEQTGARSTDPGPGSASPMGLPHTRPPP